MPTAALNPALQYVSKNKERFLQDFRTLLKQPSVSAQKLGIEDCAKIVKKQMDMAGLKAKILPVKNGNPVVYGEARSKSSSKTLLIYGHYDVQPVEPLEKWVSGPFDAKLTGRKIISRGAADSKNNVVSFIKAAESYLKSSGDVPLNLKFVVEGEEEIGSPHLPSFIDENAEKLKADSVVCYDGDMAEEGRPKFELGVKGLLYVELRCKKAKEDLHSTYAPLAENPAWRLVWAMNTIKGQDEKIMIKGPGLLQEWGLKSFPRAKNNREAFKHYMTEPTCTICGFKTGYIGEGSKTVLPGSAMLKIDFRIVNDQNPRKLLQLLKEHLHSHGFDDIQVKALGLVEPSTTKPSAPIAKAAEKAGKMVYGRAPVVMPRNPASGPDYLFTKHLGLDSIWTGSGPPSAYSHAHAPNEWTTVDNFLNGIRYIATIMDCYATTN